MGKRACLAFRPPECLKPLTRIAGISWLQGAIKRREHQHSQLTSGARDFKDTLPNARRHGGRFRLFREPHPDPRSGSFAPYQGTARCSR